MSALRRRPATSTDRWTQRRPIRFPDSGQNMSEGKQSLSAWREKIDRIDDSLHDLLMQRADAAAAIRDLKQAGPVWRPAREAHVLRRLIARHDGPFPRVTVVQIWREIMSAMVRLQGEFAVAVYTGEENRFCRDMARDHFGAETPVAFYSSTRAVLTAVQDGSATVGVLPAPDEGEKSPWWPALAGMSGPRPAICARLPFGPSTPGQGDSAVCVANVPAEQSGDDVSLFAIRTTPEVSRARLNSAIAAAGVRPRRLIGLAATKDDSALFLAELEGFAAPDDARLARLADNETGIAESVIHLGIYALPFEAAELAYRGS